MDRIQGAVTFVGRPFPDTMMDKQRSYTACNMKMENDPVFQKFLQDNNLQKQRTNMIVFGPDNFMYWYGVLTTKVENIPSGLMKYQLPKAKVAEENSADQTLAFFNMPLNAVLPKFLKKLATRGVKVYENVGDSPTPYVLQTLNLNTKKLTQTLYVETSK